MIDPTGSDAIVAALKTAGADCVFGLPGTQNIDLFEAMRRGGMRCVVPASELAAAMMANGYARAGARPAVLATIPGPGFTWALAGLAEASLDSVPVLHLTGAPATAPGTHFQLQAIDQHSMAAPLLRGSWRIDATGDVATTIACAWRQTIAGEPGPVLVEVAAGATPFTRHPLESGDPAPFGGANDPQSHWVPDIAARFRDDDKSAGSFGTDNGSAATEGAQTGESAVAPQSRHPRESGDPASFGGAGSSQSHWATDIAARFRDDGKSAGSFGTDNGSAATEGAQAGESAVAPQSRHPRESGDPAPFGGAGSPQSHWVPDIAARFRDDDKNAGDREGEFAGAEATPAGEAAPTSKTRHPRESGDPASFGGADTDPATANTIDRIATRLAAAQRCLLFVGQGCNACGDQVVRLAERLRAAVVTTTSGRGVVAEDHALSLGTELSGYSGEALNALIDTCDIVFALGCKFSHNGARGFSLRIPQSKLIHVDASAQVPSANYPASVALVMDAGRCLEGVLTRLGPTSATHGFSAADIAAWRQRGLAELDAESRIEPHLRDTNTHTPGQFFAALRATMPRDSHLVTDSGRHQDMARRHYRVFCPAGLITPTNFQSMGFSIAAATGACLAQPGRSVVALLGDGGLAMAGLQLATAVALDLKLTVIVFVDGVYGAIRDQQIGRHGRTSGTTLPGLDCAALADAVGAHYVPLQGDTATVLRETLAAPGVKLVEVPLGDGLPLRAVQAKARVRRMLHGRIGAWLRRLRH